MLKKRIDSYDKIEEVLEFFSSSVFESEGLYHYIFYSDTDNVEVHAQRCGRYTQLLTQLTKSNIYISEQLRE